MPTLPPTVSGKPSMVLSLLATARLAAQYLWARPLAALLNLLLLTLGLASVSFVHLVGAQLDRSFTHDLAGVDLVVGAKGSPLQLILAGVFHLDVPPGNVRLQELQALARHPQVAAVIPLSLGDQFQSYRIVGTTPAYVAHYGATVAQGVLWAQPMEAVLGHQVAGATALGPGASLQGAHGLSRAGGHHDDHPFRVVGVLAPCACVLDRLVLTATESVWEVHGGAPAGAQAGKTEQPREVTLALVRYASPLAAVALPRWVNSQTAMQAASPATEITRLLRMVGVGSEVLRGLGAVLLLSAGLSVFIALWSAVHERRGDLAMLRMLGASPRKLAALLLMEALWLAGLAMLLGLALGHGMTAWLGHWLADQGSVPLSGAVLLASEAWIALLALLVAVAAASLPAWNAYRVDVAQLLNSR